MRAALAGLALIATPAMSQSLTNCYPVGNTVSCITTTTPPPAPAPNLEPLYREAVRPSGPSAATAGAEQAPQATGSAERRAAAYAQVGALIAKGDCEGAKRLAAFYGHKDIVEDTERACR